MNDLLGELLILLLTWTPTADDAFKEAYAGARRLEDCAGLLKAYPRQLESYECYWRAARRKLRFEEGARMLGELLEANPGDHWARVFLGLIQLDRHQDRAEETLRLALAGFERENEPWGQAWAHSGLYFFLHGRGRLNAAIEALDAAVRVAKRSGEPVLLGEMQLLEGRLAFQLAEYHRAWVLFKKLEHEKPDNMRRCFHADVLEGLAETARRLGRYRESLDYYRRELEEVRRFVVPVWEAEIRYFIALVASRVQTPRRFSPAELLAFDREALAAARRARDPKALGRARLLVGMNPALQEKQRLAHLEAALEILEEVGYAEGTFQTLRELAVARLAAGQGDVKGAFRLVDEAIRRAGAQGSAEDLAWGLIARAQMRWQAGPRQKAIADSVAALDAIEKIRGLQKDETIHARVLGRFAFAYRRFSGYLLDPRRGPVSPADRELAFRFCERMRARVLLGALEESRPDASPEKREERQRLRRAIVAVQKRLLNPLSPAERSRALSELEKLEIELIALHSATPDRPSRLASLPEIQAALDADQALLAYQMEGGANGRGLEESFPGSSWVVSVTRDQVRARRIDDGEVVQPEIELTLGLIARRDGSEGPAASRLYRRLLAPALEQLPGRIRRLVILPDGPLHRLPFGALRPAPKAPPLAVGYQLSVAPSATLWLRWQRTPPAPRRIPALALADPTLPGAGLPGTNPRVARRAAGLFGQAMRLKPLPYAREEARALVDRLGAKSALIEGAQASEQRLKDTPLADYRILHLAAHAVVDPRVPRRSAVILAPGSQHQDGLLQAGEIAGLSLSGLAVILSTCDSARGEVLAGEGVMSLSRAFYQAGARAVVGNLWRLRDDEAAGLIGRLADHLADGLSLGEALSTAKQEWIGAGRPAAAWAGLILQGDADLVVAPAGKTGGGDLLLLSAAAVLLAGWWLTRRRLRLPSG